MPQHHKPFYQHVEKQTIEQQPYNIRHIGYMVNESILSRTLFTRHNIVLGDGFSFVYDDKRKPIPVVPIDKKNASSSDELDKFMLNYFEEFMITDWTEAVLTGLYYNFHNTFVARYYTDSTGYVELPYRAFSSIMHHSVGCRLGTVHLTPSGVSVHYNNRIVGTCNKVQQAYADPYTYHKTGKVHCPETGKVKSYSHYDYTIDSLGKQHKTKVSV